MDPAARPDRDFYRYAAGGWIRSHPIPPDKARWGAFGELSDWNYARIREILEETSRPRWGRAPLPERQVGAFFASAMDRVERRRRGFSPLADDLLRIQEIASTSDLIDALAVLHERGMDAGFSSFSAPDKKESGRYAFYVIQGGLALPDRDYYLRGEFAGLRREYRAHVARMFGRLGEPPRRAAASATTVLSLERAIARGSRSRTELRDEEKNYHPQPVRRLAARHPSLDWKRYFAGRGLSHLRTVVVGQPEVFDLLDRLVRRRGIRSFKVYLLWQLVHLNAPYLDPATEAEDFRFFHRTLLGQRSPEPDWKRAARVIDDRIGEALGRLFVARHFPPAARRRMEALVNDLKAVFHRRLRRLDWMTPRTRRKALQKFARFTTKIGHPRRFRDYSSVDIDPRDYFGNVRRADAFEVRRQKARIGGPVDRTEWGMTPPTVNAYFNPMQNEIVFPAGILQPPFFDVRMDDAVNYGGIGAVIGHEITHGYDDRGRKHDAEGNLRDWWTPHDAREFERRARRVVREYNGYEPLPGVHVNGQLTLGENIADLGGVRIALDALRRRLDRGGASRRRIDGLTPEQRFFVAHAQLWRENCRSQERRRLLTIDPHSPGRFRGTGPISQLPEFYSAFGIGPGAPMWRPPSQRIAIW